MEYTLVLEANAERIESSSLSLPTKYKVSYMQIGKIYFDKIHLSCPEQYDVYKDNQLIGCVRLRYGILRLYIDNNTVYKHTFDAPFKGEFSSEEERMQYMTEISGYLE